MTAKSEVVTTTAFGDDISVIIPTFNRSGYILKTIESILSQTTGIREIILVDDGSTDQTASIIERWSAAEPRRARLVKYIFQPNQGKSVALNRGLLAASGSWIAFNDSDDIWLPSKLQMQAALLERFPKMEACFTDARFINNPHMEFTALQPVLHLLKGNDGILTNTLEFFFRARSCIYMQTIVVRRSLLDRIGCFDPRLRVSQDTDFNFRLARSTALGFVKQPLVEIDRAPATEGRLTTAYHRKTIGRLQAQEVSFRKWLMIAQDDPAWVRNQISNVLRSNISSQANLLKESGDFRSARKLLTDELRRAFSLRIGAKWALLTLRSKLLT